MKEAKFEIEGKIVDVKRGLFLVECDTLGIVSCTIAGKLRKYNIRLVTGDTVLIELGSYDLTKGRVTKRL